MWTDQHNALVVLGATASGKTRLAVELAREYGGEILSADSRQVYRGLDIGSGKDLAAYSEGGPPVPYHLIDIVGLDREFSVFEFQQRFYEAFESVCARGVMPVVAGGTGMYLEAALRAYRMVEVPEDPALRAELDSMPDAALTERLRAARGALHNVTDTEDRARLIRAIEIAEYSAAHEPPPAPDIRPFILGTVWERDVLRQRIRQRLRERFNAGMIAEVKGLHAQGVPWERLERLGLEYRYIAEYLQGRIPSYMELEQQLWTAICQFAKRQETWFRRMERNGTVIHWIPGADVERARRVLKTD